MIQSIRKTRTAALLGALSLLAACATYDRQDEFVLGGATQQNIAAQSVRDVNLPNSRQVEDSSGVRAVKAVKAMHEGRQTQSASAASAGGARQ